MLDLVEDEKMNGQVNVHHQGISPAHHDHQRYRTHYESIFKKADIYFHVAVAHLEEII